MCLPDSRPYEAVPGTTNEIHRKWVNVCKQFVSEGYPSRRRFKKLCREIIEDFDRIELLDMKKPRVGIVGEILVKFHPAANNHLGGSAGKRGSGSRRTGRRISCFIVSITRISKYQTSA